MVLNIYIRQCFNLYLIFALILGIGPYVWNSNCHRGDQGAKENATAFPQSVGLAASFR